MDRSIYSVTLMLNYCVWTDFTETMQFSFTERYTYKELWSRNKTVELVLHVQKYFLYEVMLNFLWQINIYFYEYCLVQFIFQLWLLPSQTNISQVTDRGTKRQDTLRELPKYGEDPSMKSPLIFFILFINPRNCLFFKTKFWTLLIPSKLNLQTLI